MSDHPRNAEALQELCPQFRYAVLKVQASKADPSEEQKRLRAKLKAQRIAEGLEKPDE